MKKTLSLLLLFLTLGSCNKIVEMYNSRGNTKSSLGNYEAAIEDYTNAIEIDTSIAYVYSNRADAYYKLKKYNDAIVDYNKAIDLNPNVPNYYFKKGLINLLRYPQIAIEENTQAIKLHFEFAEAYNNRGVAKRNLGNYIGALEDFEKAHQINPNLSPPTNNITYTTLLLEKKDPSVFKKSMESLAESFICEMR